MWRLLVFVVFCTVLTLVFPDVAEGCPDDGEGGVEGLGLGDEADVAHMTLDDGGLGDGATELAHSRRQQRHVGKHLDVVRLALVRLVHLVVHELELQLEQEVEMS